MSSFQRTIKYCAIAFAAFLAITIITGIVSAVVSIGSAVSGEHAWNSDRKTIDFSENFTGVEGLDIDVSSGELTIKSGDTFRVEAENVPDSFEAKVSGNGTLTVNEDKDSVHFLWFNFGGFGHLKSKITLYLPADFIADYTDINTGAGKITIEALHTQDLIVSAGAGDVYGSHVVADEVSIDGGVGNVNLTDISFRNADLNCGVGNLKIEGELLGDNKIECGVGDVDLELEGNEEDYDLNVDSGVGTVRVNDEKISGRYNNDNADNSIDINGGIGNVRIKFNE